MSNNQSERTKGLQIFTSELGVDMSNVYSKSIHHKFYLPEFVDIYDEYKMSVLLKNADNSMKRYDEISQHLNAFNQDIDWSNMTVEGIKEIDVRNERELFNYLLEKHYSFEFDKIYNSPIKGVW